MGRPASTATVCMHTSTAPDGSRQVACVTKCLLQPCDVAAEVAAFRAAGVDGVLADHPDVVSGAAVEQRPR
jgi:hypothetical protein